LNLKAIFETRSSYSSFKALKSGAFGTGFNRCKLAPPYCGVEGARGVVGDALGRARVRPRAARRDSWIVLATSEDAIQLKKRGFTRR